MNSSDNRLAERARALYHRAAEHVDADTAQRLRAARARALDQRRTHSLRPVSRWLLPGGALTAVMLAALMLWPSLPRQGMGGSPAGNPVAINAADSDLPPDADQTDPKLYQNLDFYGWLAANNAPANRR